MEKKWFVALLMVVVMMCACWTGAVADEERKTFTSGDYQYALLMMEQWRLQGTKGAQTSLPFLLSLMERRLPPLATARSTCALP